MQKPKVLNIVTYHFELYTHVYYLKIKYLFERGPESKIGRGDHVLTVAGYEISRTKKWTVLNYKTFIIIKTRQQPTYIKITNKCYLCGNNQVVDDGVNL
jgi:ribosomal protein S17